MMIVVDRSRCVRDMGHRTDIREHTFGENTVRLQWNFLRQSLRRWPLRRDELLGKVRSLGGWVSLSRWLQLGQLRVAGMRTRLIVRAIENDAPTVMNLFGVRLIPMESA
jgi:hypothetical protein